MQSVRRRMHGRLHFELRYWGLLPRAAQPESEVSSAWDDNVESYACNSCNTTLQVWIRRRTFYVVRAQRGVPLATNGKPLRTCKMNAKGGMTVGWKDSIAIAWAIAVEVAGGTKEANDAMAALAVEREQLKNEDANPRRIEDGNNPPSDGPRGVPARPSNLYLSSSHDPRDEVLFCFGKVTQKGVSPVTAAANKENKTCNGACGR